MYRSQVTQLRQWVRGVPGLRAYRPATEPLDLDSLISPLRYDIMVRADFFDYLSERLEDYEADFDRFAADATATTYYAWFAKVALARYRPRQARDPARVMVEFRERLHRSVRLLTSFTAGGFDLRHPISVRTAVPGALTGTGKLVPRKYYAGDGCHRLALLVRVGETSLAPSHYRVRRDPETMVVDNTQLLIRELGLTPEQYFRFLSRGYADRPYTDARALLNHVEERAPDRLGELRAVIAADEGAFVRPSQGSAATRAD